MNARDPAAVLRRHTHRLMAIPGVVGVAQGGDAGRPCILVMVARRTPDILARLPDSLDGVPTRILETGRPEALGRS